MTPLEAAARDEDAERQSRHLTRRSCHTGLRIISVMLLLIRFATSASPMDFQAHK